MAKEPQQQAGAAPEQRSEKPSKRKKEFKKKREKRVVPHGVANIQATFNNTIMTICGPDGRAVIAGLPPDRLVQGFAQRHAVRRAAGLRDRRGSGARPVRHEIGGSPREGSRLRPRIGRARAGLLRAAHRAHQGRDADSAQRLPSSEAPPRLMCRC